MIKDQINNNPEYFDSLFKIFSSQRFLNREGLGGNRAIFIQPYQILKQGEVDFHLGSLVKRLEQNGIPILAINLFELCLSILKSKGVLQKVFDAEKSKSKSEFKRDIRGSLDIKNTILPEINKLMLENDHKLIVINGIDKMFPFLSVVGVLVNIQSLLKKEPIVFFYPGDYDNFSLNLFGKINEYNEYRAFNLSNYN
jgi:hypothetical protein